MDEPGRSSRRRVKVVLLVAGAAAILAVLYVWPSVSLSYAKSRAMAKLSKIPPNDRASIHCVLGPDVRQVPTVEVPGPSVRCAAGGWCFRLPASEYRGGADPNRPNVLESDRLAAHFVGVGAKTPRFKQGHAPSIDEVHRYYEQTDPYQVLCDAFATTPADVEAAGTHAELQKTLYLLLLRSVFQPLGSEKQWLRIEVGGRRGFLAGDATCKLVRICLYLPETRQFADFAIAPADGAGMDEVYRCLGQLRIERDDALVPGLLSGGDEPR